MQSTRMQSKRIASWHIVVTFLFPAFYFLAAMTPWGVGLWAKGNRDFFPAYWLTVIALHWIGAALVMWFLKKDGLSIKDLGYRLGTKKTLVLAGSLLAAALGIFFFTEAAAPPDATVSAGWMSVFYPVTTTERIVWIFCCLTAGFCEELVYRGYNISMLRFKGMNKWLALVIAAFPFVLIHSFAPIYSGYLFGVYFSAAIIFGLIYLLTKRLWVPMAVHCLYNLTAMMAVLGEGPA